jgi:formylglycine-generating enzyme required for sulfatase activity
MNLRIPYAASLLALIPLASSCQAGSGQLPMTKASSTTIFGALRDCAECPEIIAIPGADKLGFGFATKYEITWQDYGRSVTENGCVPPLAWPERLDSTRKRKLRVSQDDRRFATQVAVSGISVTDAACFVTWLNRKTGKSYFLPSPQQWRHLAYGQATTVYPWGNELPLNRALIGDAYDRRSYRKEGFLTADISPRVVGQLPPNKFGLYDVIGNAGELTNKCEDFHINNDRDKIKRFSCVVLGGDTTSINPIKQNPSTEYKVLISDQYPDAFVGIRLVRN